MNIIKSNIRWGVCALVSTALLAASANAAGTLGVAQFGKAITFKASGYDGSSELENFPVLVRLSEGIAGFSYSDLGTTSAEAYSNLRFADESGENLDYEIETWDATGTSYVWVSLPSLSGTDTRFSAYYGADVSYTPPAVYPTNVWTSAGYVAVWHLSERIPDDYWRYIYTDSTGRGSPAHGAQPMASDGQWTITEQATAEPQANGTPYFSTIKKGGSRHILATGDVANWDLESTGYSAESWFYVSEPNWITILAGGTGSGIGTNAISLSKTSRMMTMYTSSDKKASPALESNCWHYVTAVWKGTDSANTYSRLYAVTNGSESVVALARPSGNAVNPKDGAYGITGGNNGSGSRNNDADEVRIRIGESSEDWIQANWDTQRVGTDFLEYGAVHNPSDEVAIMSFSTVSVGATEVSFAAEYEVGNSIAGTMDVTANLILGDTTNSLGVVGSISSQNGALSFSTDDLLPDTGYGLFLTIEYDGEPHASSAVAFRTQALAAPAISGTTATAATATGAFSITGATYTGGKAVLTDMATRTETEIAIPDISAPSVALPLSESSDYTVKFVFSRSNGTTVETPLGVIYTPSAAAFDPSIYRKGVTFTATGYDGNETLENFPVLVRFTESTLPGFTYATAARGDIRFADASGNLLPFDIENWNQDGHTAIWVSLPELSGTDTSFTMYWRPQSGAATVAAPPSCRVWSRAGYAGVWHMNELMGTGASYRYAYDKLYGYYYPDSSGWGRNAAKGSTDWLSIPHLPSNDVSVAANGTSWHNGNIPIFVPSNAWAGIDTSETGYTAETWVWPTRPSGNLHIMFSTYTNNYTSANELFFNRAEARMASKSWHIASYWNEEKAYEDAWHFISAIWTGQDAQASSALYGTSASSTGPAYMSAPNGDARAADLREHGIGLTSYTSIEINTSSGGSNFYVDEMRIRLGSSSTDWIQANWDTQRMGSDFLTQGEVFNRQPPMVIFLR